ncbi:MAG: hypothetical protein ACKO1Q_02325 [Vulcanococcus sp.]
MQAQTQTPYRRPRIATLKHRATPYRGEWVIYQAANHQYLACHEVIQLQGERKTVEQVSLASLADAQQFSGYLSTYGWSKDWLL